MGEHEHSMKIAPEGAHSFNMNKAGEVGKGTKELGIAYMLDRLSGELSRLDDRITELYSHLDTLRVEDDANVSCYPSEPQPECSPAMQHIAGQLDSVIGMQRRIQILLETVRV